ncbi:MAG: iron-siderophore ABC transporter substrate-binding protein [Cyanobacteria bacterium P01_G01_bin.19]
MLLSIRFLVMAAIALCAISLTAWLRYASCQSKVNEQQVSTSNRTDCRTIEHEAGETEVCGQPQRIVVLGPYVLEPLLALGVQPVAYGDHVAFHQGDYDRPDGQIPYLGEMIIQPLANVGLAYEPSIEAIVKVKPDLIIGIEANAKQYDILSQIAPTILLDYDAPETNLKAIAQSVNRSVQAEQVLKETQQQIAAFRQAFAHLVATHSKLLLLFTSSNLQEINLGNSDGLCSSLVKDLGFQLVSLPELKNPEPNSPNRISIETLPRLNDADLVIVFSVSNGEFKNMNNFNQHQLAKIKQVWADNAIAQSLDASKAGRVYFIPTYLCAGLPGAIGTEIYLEELEQQLLPP